MTLELSVPVEELGQGFFDQPWVVEQPPHLMAGFQVLKKFGEG